MTSVPASRDMSRRSENDAFTGVAAFLMVVALLLCAPGLVVTFAVDQLLGLRLDRAQLWAFGGSLSCAMLCASVVASRGLLLGFARYVLASLATVAALGVAHHGLKIEAVAELWSATWP